MRNHLKYCGLVFSLLATAILFTDVVFPMVIRARHLRQSEISPEYREAALEAMLGEINEYAKGMKLPENLPITTESLRSIHVSTPQIAERTGGLGNLHTANYGYAFGRGHHLTSITRLPKDKSGRPLYERYKPWKIDPSAVNTNSAFQVASQILLKAHVDLDKLSRMAPAVSIHPIVVLDMTTSVYQVEWKSNGETLVEVGLDEPTRELWLLRVHDASLILRKPLLVPDEK